MSRRPEADPLPEPWTWPREILYLLPAMAMVLAFGLYAVTSIPEVVLPPSASDPFFFDILSEIIGRRGVLLPGLPEYFFTPIYAYWYALGKTVFPDIRHCLTAIVITQNLLFAVSIYWMYRFSFFVNGSRRWALGTAYLYGLFPPLLFYSVLPLKDIVTVAALVFVFFSWSRCERSWSWPGFVASGIAFGLALHLRGSLFGAAPIFLLSARTRFGVRPTLAFTAAASLLFVPFLARNWIVAGVPVLTSNVAGIHQYIGNNERATGYYDYLEGIRPDGFGHHFDAIKMASRAAGRELTGVETNAYWKRKAAAYVAEHPGRAAALFLRKITLMLGGDDLPSSYSYDDFRSRYPPFILAGGFPLWPYLLPVFGVAGLLLCRFPYRKELAGALVGVVLVSSLGFVTSRYRIVGAPLLIVPATEFLRGFRGLWRGPRRRVLLGSLIALSVISFWPAEVNRAALRDRAERKHRTSARLLARARTMEPAEFEASYERRRREFVTRYTDVSLLE